MLINTSKTQAQADDYRTSRCGSNRESVSAQGIASLVPLLVFGRDVTYTGISLHHDGLRGHSSTGPITNMLDFADLSRWCTGKFCQESYPLLGYG